MGIVKRDGFWITVISYFGVGLGYLNKILLLPNFFSTEQVGLINVMVNIAIMYAQFSTLGSNNIMLRFFPFFRNKEEKHHGFLFWMALISLTGFALVTLLFIFLKEPITNYYSIKSPLLVDYYYYIIVLGFALLLQYIFENYQRSLLKNVFYTFVNDVLLRILISSLITLFIFKTIDFRQFVVLYLVIYLVIACIHIGYTIYIGQLFLFPSKSFLFRRLWKNVLNYGLFGQLGNISRTLNANIDSLMIAGLLGLDKTGVYLTMYFITGLLLVPYNAIMKVANPIVAGLWKDNDIKGLEDLYKKVTLNNLLLGVFLFLAVWVNINNLLALMPNDYHEGVYVFFFVGLGKIIDMSTGINGTIIITSKKYQYDVLFSAVLILITVGLNYFLIKQFGIIGAAISVTATITIFQASRIIFVYKLFKIQPFTKGCLLIVALLVIIITFFSKIEYIGNYILDIAFRSILVCLIYFVPAYFLKVSTDFNSIIDKGLEIISKFKK